MSEEQEPIDDKALLRKHLVLAFLVIGTPVMFVISLFAMGGEEGTWDVAKVFFPLAIIFATSADKITAAAALLGILQNPIYAAILLGTRKKSWKMPVSIIVIIHTVFVVLAFNP